MSLNLALEKGKALNHSFLYQTPTKVSLAAMKSNNPSEFYKRWVTEERQGNFAKETKLHFKKLDALLAEGWKFTII